MKKKRVIFRHRLHSLSVRISQYCTLAVLVILMLFVPGQNIYTVQPLYSRSDSYPTVQIPKMYPYPENVTGVVPGGDITAEGIVIRDVDSGALLYRRNGNIQFAPASTTKILTALVSFDTYQLDDVVTVHNPVVDGQVMGLVDGETITVENLLYGTLVHSGNDAAFALAQHWEGGEEQFVNRMNEMAQDLGMLNSVFRNPAGFDDPSQRMTPDDLSRLALAAVRNKTIAKMVSIPAITISDTTHTYFHSLKNVNQLLGRIPGVGGIKTGWTQEAGENLVTLVERDGHRVVFVVLRSQNRFDDTVLLIDWVWGNFEWKTYSSEPVIPSRAQQ